MKPKSLAAWGRSGAIAAVALVSGCYLSHSRPEGGDEVADASIDALGARDSALSSDAEAAQDDGGRSGIDAGAPTPFSCADPRAVDLLLVLDDSGSIRSRGPLLQDRLRRMAYMLARPPDLDRDGAEDWPRVQDMHLGVVSTSVEGPASCADAADGRLASEPVQVDHCLGEYPPFLTYREGATDPERFAHDLSCVAFGPRDGCMIEQPLEAMAKALLPRAAPFEYVAGGPHGDVENAGLLRSESVLAVVVVSDEDDCSLVDPTIAELGDDGLDSGRFGPAGCTLAQPAQLHPIERYEAALRWLRPEHPERIVLAMVVGIASGLIVTDPSELADPPGCAEGTVYPRRLHELTLAFSSQSLIGSICDMAEMDVIHAITRRVSHAACGI